MKNAAIVRILVFFFMMRSDSKPYHGLLILVYACSDYIMVSTFSKTLLSIVFHLKEWIYEDTLNYVSCKYVSNEHP